MSIKASFCVTVDYDLCLDETRLETYFKDNDSQLLDKDYLDGELILITSDQPELRIEDEFYPLIQNFCFAVIFSLAENKEVEILNFSYNGSVKFSPVGLETEISGEFVPTIRIATIELIQALYECGQRALKFFWQLQDQGFKVAATLEYLITYEEQARQAILQAGLPLNDASN